MALALAVLAAEAEHHATADRFFGTGHSRRAGRRI